MSLTCVLQDRGLFSQFDRQQRSFKSDSGLGSEFKIGRRNSRGHACSPVPSRVPSRASGARVGDRQFYEWGPHVVRTLPRYAAYRFREAVRCIKKKEEERSESLGREEKKERSPTLMGKGGRTGTNGGEVEKEKNKKKKRTAEGGGRRKKKKRWNSVVYPVIYNCKLGTTARPKAICRFHPGESPPSTRAQFAEGHSTFDRNRCSLW